MFQVNPRLNQALFSSKDKSKKWKCRLLQFLFGALRVNRGQIRKENMCFPWSKFFPFRVDPILEELDCPGKQTGSHKSWSPL